MDETGSHNLVGVGALGAIREVGLSLNFEAITNATIDKECSSVPRPVPVQYTYQFTFVFNCIVLIINIFIQNLIPLVENNATSIV